MMRLSRICLKDGTAERDAEYVPPPAGKRRVCADVEASLATAIRALHDVIATDHHNHYDGPTARYVQIARAALARIDASRKSHD